jgi:hypothetical protein
VSASAVVLETYHLANFAGLRRGDADQHVPDQARFVGFARLGVEVEDADAGKLLPPRGSRSSGP